MLFTCDNCGRIFEHPYAPIPCPDCGSGAVRPANEAEQKEFSSYQTESHFPDLVETEIEVVDCFRFKLPATAMGINSNKIIEIVVEHGMSARKNNVITANIWARPVGGVLSGFLLPIEVPAKQNESVLERSERIVTAINSSDQFMEQLCKFITMLINRGV